MSSHTLRKPGPIDPPPGVQRLTARQIAIAQEARRNGDSLNLISERMGISKESIFRHVKGIKPKVSNDGEAPKPPIIEPVGQKNNGGDAAPVDTPKPSVIKIEVELDPDTMLRLAGTGSVQGFRTVKEYLNEYALPWLNSLREAQELLGANSPEIFLAKLNEIAKGYVTYQRVLDQAKKEVSHDVSKSDGNTNIVSQKN